MRVTSQRDLPLSDSAVMGPWLGAEGQAMSRGTAVVRVPAEALAEPPLLQHPADTPGSSGWILALTSQPWLWGTWAVSQ